MSRPLSFLHLTTFYPPYSLGGDAIQVRRLAHALGDQGHHVEVIHCVSSYHLLHPGPPPVQFEEHPNVKRHELRSGFGSLSPLLTQQTGRAFLKRDAIRQVLASRHFDVIHFHNVSLLGPEVLSMAAESDAVRLYTAHEHWLVCPTHVLWKFNREACVEPQCLECVLRAKRPPQLWRYSGYLERMSRHVDQFVAPSRFTARMHADRKFPRPMAHLPNFTDPAEDEWRNPGPRPHQAPYFLFVGRLEEYKGLQRLIAVWDRVNGHDLVAVGSGGYELELRSMAAGNPRIHLLGQRSQQELGALYLHAAATIIPSLTYETFGLTGIESFARMTPVIVANTGALPELVEDSGGGLIFSSDEELLQALHRIGGEEGLRHQLGAKGYAAFVERWSPAAHLRKYFALLEETALRKTGGIPWK